MPQKTLDGKTSCRGVKGTCTVRFTGRNPEIEAGLKEVTEKYPCVKITVNRKPLKEIQKEWDKEVA